jgi:hypothetical protein
MPWEIEKIDTYDDLFKIVVVEQKRPAIPTDKSNS